MWLILGSVLIGLSSSAIVAFAYIMQKKAYLQIAGTNRKVYKTCTWLIGFCLMFFGSILSLGNISLLTYMLFIYLATLAVLDQTTLTSMSGSTLIFSTIFSRAFLKEPCTSLVLVQVFLLLIGASLMLIFSSKEIKEFNL